MADATFMADLAKAWGLRSPTLDRKGCCELELAPNLWAAMRCQPDTGLLNIAIALGHSISSTRDDLYVTLMLANRSLAEQGDPHFALSPDASRAVLCRTLRVGPQDLHDAVQVLRQMVAAASDFRTSLSNHGLINVSIR